MRSLYYDAQTGAFTIENSECNEYGVEVQKNIDDCDMNFVGATEQDIEDCAKDIAQNSSFEWDEQIFDCNGDWEIVHRTTDYDTTLRGLIKLYAYIASSQNK